MPIGFIAQHADRMAQGASCRSDCIQPDRDGGLGEYEGRRYCGAGRSDPAGLEQRNLQYDSEPFQQRDPAHSRYHSGAGHDHGIHPHHHG